MNHQIFLFLWYRSFLSWSWSCYFGLGFGLVTSGLGRDHGLKNLVLFTSLNTCTNRKKPQQLPLHIIVMELFTDM